MWNNNQTRHLKMVYVDSWKNIAATIQCLLWLIILAILIPSGTHQDDALATYICQLTLSVIKHANGSISLYTNQPPSPWVEANGNRLTWLYRHDDTKVYRTCTYWFYWQFPNIHWFPEWVCTCKQSIPDWFSPPTWPGNETNSSVVTTHKQVWYPFQIWYTYMHYICPCLWLFKFFSYTSSLILYTTHLIFLQVECSHTIVTIGCLGL